MNRSSRGVLIASAAAGLFLSGAVVARAAEKAGGDTVHCMGINACKGQGACASAANSCQGQNACKGKAWIETSKAECEKKGGKIVESKKE
ncbi:MAG: hypothetical protein E6J69_14150 [Deltaproteobacteria bacterium]|nr:MAG: hypothetical protein E6J69_14150 [Deltaproteobacteria bacterium]TMB45777.1 MAG: hypothetical protein E6J55_05100 [Deltaproteobacteria bacterium]